MTLINRPFLVLISFITLLAGCDSISPRKTDQAAVSANHTPVTQAAPIHKAQPEERKYDSVWDRIRAGYSLPHASNSTVDAQIRFYTSKKKYFYGVMQQAEPYLYFVASEMQANDMPMELALLPFIESSYNPTASSLGNQNVGMWQFGAATGRNFGLTQNNWYDGRRDVVASTDAAIRLLKKLYARFDNDWLLAIAAYNAGDGTIQQAIDKNRRAGKPTDFWSLPLNKTTQGYIPQLLALSKIIADPNVYDFNLYPIPDLPYFVKINVDSQISIADAAQQSALDVALLKKLNAGYKNGLTDPTEPRHVLVPIEAAATFRLQLDSLPKIARVKWQEHQVKKGESLNGIAKKYGVNAANIQAINSLKTAKLAPGQRLQIPLSPSTESAPAPAVAQHLSPQEKTQDSYYTVKAGENLWSIAKANNTSVETLARLNNMTSKSALKPGQRLVVQTQVSDSSKGNSVKTRATKTNESKDAQTLKYTIKSGDTLGKVAAKYDVSVKQLMQWNKIKDETSIRPKQELIVLVDAKN
jgi:membrane-bound lytic murein transglycosylase D